MGVNGEKEGGRAMRKRKSGALSLCAQAAAVFVLALSGKLLSPVRWLSALLLWIAVPAAGAITACQAVKKGVNPYLAWIFPPVSATFAGLIASMGYTPSAGAMLLCALVSLIGAAAGDVLTRPRKGGRK